MAPAVAAAAEGDALLTPQRVGVLKFAAAAATAGLLTWGIALRRAGRAHGAARTRDAALLVLGILGALGWWNFLQFRYSPGFGHPVDVFHYYVGSKYFDELGYTRLYECTTVADAESGFRELAERRSIRNLETYRRESALGILNQPRRCTRHFSPERWETFKHDVGWFRERMPEGLWQGVLSDHGYNPSPVWGAVAKLFVRAGPVTEASLSPLLLLDPLLLIAMWAFAWKAFGWRASCVALVFWGSNLPGDYLWTGSAFLRQLWLAAMIGGICCLRLQRMASGGFLLTVAALLRVFPVMAIFGVALGAALAMWRSRSFRPTPAQRRFALGCAAAAALLIPLSLATAGGARAWLDFAQNIRFHAAAPFPTNVGLPMLLSYDPATRLTQIEKTAARPDVAWSEARRTTLARRRLLFAGALVAYLLLLARAVDGKPEWVAAVLGTGAVVVATSMSNYYYGVLLGFGFLWLRRDGIGAALCALAALGWWIDWTWPAYDEVYTWLSLATLVFAFAATGLMARERPREPAPGT